MRRPQVADELQLHTALDDGLGLDSEDGSLSGPTAPSRVRILLVDDHELVLEGLGAFLGREQRCEVVAKAGTAAEALAAADRFVPDLVIMDVRLPDGSGIEACREIKSRHPDVRVVILTGSGDEETVLTAVIAGANGFLLKQSGARDVLRAVDVVSTGGSSLDPVATDQLLRRIRRLGEAVEKDPIVDLSARERQILELIAMGKTNREIGAAIGLSEKTVKRAVSSILSKLHLDRRAEAAAMLARRRPQG